MNYPHYPADLIEEIPDEELAKINTTKELINKLQALHIKRLVAKELKPREKANDNFDDWLRHAMEIQKQQETMRKQEIYRQQQIMKTYTSSSTLLYPYGLFNI